MSTVEIKKACLEERRAKKEKLQKEFSQLDFECEKAFFEESMYIKLEERHSLKYREDFSEKQQLCKQRVDNFEKEKEQLKKEIGILEREIEYLEELF